MINICSFTTMQSSNSVLGKSAFTLLLLSAGLSYDSRKQRFDIEVGAIMVRNDLTISDQDVHTSIAESILQGLIPSGYKLELNAKSRMLSLLSTHSPHILAQQQFTRNEWGILLTLLTSYPYYAPHEILLASLTSLSPADCRERLQEAQQSGSMILKRELKPVHRALSGVRTKLNKLHPPLKISLIRNLGYALTTLSE